MTKLKAQERTTLARAEASERLNAQIVDGLTSGLLVAGSDGQIRALNPAGHRILGLAPRPMPARHRRAAAGRAGAGRAGPRRGQGRPHRRLAPPRGDGAGGRAVASGGHAVALGRQPAGRSRRICLFTDLSRVVALEEQLRLKDALARLGELTAGLAHEFRNGLATIHGYARLLDPGTLPAPQSAYAAGLRAETDTLGELVTNFLNFARPERVSLQPLNLEASCGAPPPTSIRRRGGARLGPVRRGRGRRRAVAAGVLEPDAQRPRGLPRRRHRARGRRARRGARRRRDGDGDRDRQRPRTPRGRPRSAVPALLHDARRRHRAWAGAGAEVRRHAQRARARGQRRRRGRGVRGPPAPAPRRAAA